MIKCKQAENASCDKDCCQEYGENDWLSDICDEAEEILNKQVPDVIKAISDICTQKKKLEEQEKKMKESLQNAMEQYGVKKFENEVISVTYVAPTVRNTIDSAKLKKELPDVASKYNKQSNVSASVRITVK